MHIAMYIAEFILHYYRYVAYFKYISPINLISDTPRLFMFYIRYILKYYKFTKYTYI